jgi:cGMP-dependent protein kinase 1
MGGKNIKAINIINNANERSKSPQLRGTTSILKQQNDKSHTSPIRSITIINKDDLISSVLARHETMNPKILQTQNSFMNVKVTHNKKKLSIKGEHEKINLNSVNKITNLSPTRKLTKRSKKVESIPSNEANILKVIKKHNKDFDDAKLIDFCLTKHFLIRNLDRQSRAEVIKQMSLCGVKEGDIIFSQHSIGNYFYIIKKGMVELSINDVRIKTLEDGESFGDLALLHDAPRTGTLKAITECYLWVLERKNFKKIIDHINNINFDENKLFVESISLLANIENDSKNIISANMVSEIYEIGDHIIKFGEVSNNLYIMKEGIAECVSKGMVMRKLTKGDHFGERGLLLDSTRSMDVVAKTRCVCYSISSETFKRILGENFRDVIILNFVKNALARSKYLNKFNHKFIDHVSECFQLVNYNLGDVAFTRGHQKNTILSIIIEGNLLNVRKKLIL